MKPSPGAASVTSAARCAPAPRGREACARGTQPAWLRRRPRSGERVPRSLSGALRTVSVKPEASAAEPAAAADALRSAGTAVSTPAQPGEARPARAKRAYKAPHGSRTACTRRPASPRVRRTAQRRTAAPARGIPVRRPSRPRLGPRRAAPAHAARAGAGSGGRGACRAAPGGASELCAGWLYRRNCASGAGEPSIAPRTKLCRVAAPACITITRVRAPIR